MTLSAQSPPDSPLSWMHVQDPKIEDALQGSRCPPED